MQDNTITLAVDTANNGTTSDKVYTRISVDGNRSTYINKAEHQPHVRNMLQLYRSDAKPSGNDAGTRKCAVKFTVDQTVPNRDGSGDMVKPLIVEVNIAIPEGTDAAQVLALRQHVVTLMDVDDVMEDLCTILEI
jgi:hypothetical protein